MRSKRENAVKDKPFDAGVLKRARGAVEMYRFSFWKEEGRFIGQCVEMDTLGVGKNPDAAVEQARDLAVTAAAVMLEDGKRLPLPTAGQARTVQVNIRLSPMEKRAIEDAANALGFRGISDYLRIRGLATAQ